MGGFSLEDLNHIGDVNWNEVRFTMKGDKIETIFKDKKKEFARDNANKKKLSSYFQMR